MAHVSDDFRQSLQAHLSLNYLELATQLFHQRVAMQHHASADLFSHTCPSAQIWCVGGQDKTANLKNASDEAAVSGSAGIIGCMAMRCMSVSANWQCTFVVAP